MSKQTTAAIFGATLFLGGCTMHEASKRGAEELAPSAATIIDVPTEMGSVVRCIFEDTRGRLWIGGEDLYCHDGTTLTCYDVRDNNGWGVTIKAIVEDLEGNVWLGTTGGLTKIDGNHFSSYGVKHGLVSRDVWCLAVDGEGVLWIGTIDGACRFDGKAFTHFDAEDGLATPGLMSILEDHEGRLWLGGVKGVFRFDGESFARVTKPGPWQ